MNDSPFSLLERISSSVTFDGLNLTFKFVVSVYTCSVVDRLREYYKLDFTYCSSIPDNGKSFILLTVSVRQLISSTLRSSHSSPRWFHISKGRILRYDRSDPFVDFPKNE